MVSKTILIKIIAGLVIAGAASAIGALYTQIWDPMWNPFRPEPEIVLEQAGMKFLEAKTFRSKIDFELRQSNKEEVNFTLKAEGEQDLTDSVISRLAAKFDTVFSGEGMELSAAGDIVEIGEVVYLKLADVPAIPDLDLTLALLGINLKEFKNQWIRINEESLKKTFGEEYEPVEVEEKLESLMRGVGDLLKDKTLFKVEKELPDEEIEGKKFYHYAVSLDKGAFKSFLTETLRLGLKYAPEEEKEKAGVSEEITDKFLDDFSKVWEEFLQKIEETNGITVEVWIGKRDKLPYKIKFEKEIDITQLTEKEEGMIAIKFNADFLGFDQPVKIEAPQNFKTLDEFIKPAAFPGFLPGVLPAGLGTEGAFPVGDLKIEDIFPGGVPPDILERLRAQ